MQAATTHHCFKAAEISITTTLLLLPASTHLSLDKTLISVTTSSRAFIYLSCPYLISQTTVSFAIRTAMKLASAAALLLLAPLSASTPSPSFFDSQSPIKVEQSGPPVKGDNPLTYCADPSDYILQIESVNLKPNPPQA